MVLDEAKRNQTRSKRIRITKEDEENLMAAANYLDHHFAFAVSLEQVSKIAYMGNTKLKTTFREYFGCSVSDYIIHKRMNQAQHLLLVTDLSISEIAKAVGYQRPDSFTKQFSKVIGLLPTAYRNMGQKR